MVGRSALRASAGHGLRSFGGLDQRTENPLLPVRARWLPRHRAHCNGGVASCRRARDVGRFSTRGCGESMPPVGENCSSGAPRWPPVGRATGRTGGEESIVSTAFPARPSPRPRAHARQHRGRRRQHGAQKDGVTPGPDRNRHLRNGSSAGRREDGAAPRMPALVAMSSVK